MSDEDPLALRRGIDPGIHLRHELRAPHRAGKDDEGRKVRDVPQIDLGDAADRCDELVEQEPARLLVEAG